MPAVQITTAIENKSDVDPECVFALSGDTELACCIVGVDVNVDLWGLHEGQQSDYNMEGLS